MKIVITRATDTSRANQKKVENLVNKIKKQEIAFVATFTAYVLAVLLIKGAVFRETPSSEITPLEVIYVVLEAIRAVFDGWIIYHYVILMKLYRTEVNVPRHNKAHDCRSLLWQSTSHPCPLS